MIDLRQFQAATQAAPMESDDLPRELPETEVEAEAEPALAPTVPDIEADPMSAVGRASPEQTARLLSAGYMEIPSIASGFICGSCEFYRHDETMCGAERIDAPVSPTSGCCDQFQPLEGVVFPPPNESVPNA